MILGDNIYSDFEYFDYRKIQNQNIQMFTPVKGLKGQSDEKNNGIEHLMTCFLPLFLKSDNP